VTPKGRERAYQKRRYEEWQGRLAAKQSRRRQQQRILAVVVSTIVVVVVIVGGFALFLNRDDDSTATAASPTPSATAAATPSASSSAAADAKNLCPPSTVKAPASPKKFSAAPAASQAAGKTWTWTVKTTCGDLTIALDGKKAPIAVSAMNMLAKAGFFDDSPCHRLTTSGIYVLQCGDPTGSGSGGPGFEYGPVENAPKDNVYKAGSVAMARQSGNGKSMGSQFFLVYKDSTIPSDTAGGYTVLGQITKGLGVVTKAAAGGSDNSTGPGDGHPTRAVSILSTTVKS
jgi:peptidyl-prolyl cis-trans isomerase B (cyclophilin B)